MKAIIFARVSSTTDRQNTNRQVADLTSYANTNNIDIVKVFSEKISGGKKNSEREILKECLSFAETEQIDVILCSELSRLSRSIWETLEAVKHCVDRKIDIFFQKENLHIFDENGKVNPIMAVYISCLGLCAEKERENIYFRLNSGRKLAIEKGVKMGRKLGSVMSENDYKEKYPISISLIRKGYKLTEVKAIATQRGEKVGKTTLTTLKKMFF